MASERAGLGSLASRLREKPNDGLSDADIAKAPSHPDRRNCHSGISGRQPWGSPANGASSHTALEFYIVLRYFFHARSIDCVRSRPTRQYFPRRSAQIGRAFDATHHAIAHRPSCHRWKEMNDRDDEIKAQAPSRRPTDFRASLRACRQGQHRPAPDIRLDPAGIEHSRCRNCGCDLTRLPSVRRWFRSGRMG